MSNITILFESVEAATKAFQTLKPMIEMSLDCNALTFNEIDEELVKWLVRDCEASHRHRYCRLGAKKRVYIYPVSITSKLDKTTLYKYQYLWIEQKFIPPADWWRKPAVVPAARASLHWEFVTRDRLEKIINSSWWDYENNNKEIPK